MRNCEDTKHDLWCCFHIGNLTMTLLFSRDKTGTIAYNRKHLPNTGGDMCDECRRREKEREREEGSRTTKDDAALRDAYESLQNWGTEGYMQSVSPEHLGMKKTNWGI